MLKAVIFDCDGVIADSEHLHFDLFRKALETKGVSLTRAEYDARYLAMDDTTCLRSVFADKGIPLSAQEIENMVKAKGAEYERSAGDQLVILPGVVEWAMAVAQKYPLAMASGARRDEVHLMLERAGILDYFEAIVAAEDVKNSKPAPDAYLAAAASLAGIHPDKGIDPAHCLVVEDSKHGVASAVAAGMKCVAVTTSYPAEDLAAADRVVPVLTALRVGELENLFKT